MTRVAWFVTIIFLTLSGAALLWRFHVEVVLFLLSVAIAAAVRPAPAYLAEHGLPPTVALLLVYVLGLGLLAAFIFLFGDAFLRELQQVSNDLASAYQTVTLQWPSGSDLQQTIAAQLPPPNALYSALSGPQGQAAAGAMLGFTASFLGVATNVALTLVLSLYWGMDYARLERLWLSLLRAEQRARAHAIWEDIEAGVGAYIRSEMVQAVAAIVMLDIGYNLLGLHYPTVLAVVGGVAWLVPLAGSILALAPVIAVGLSQGPAQAIAAGLFTLAVLGFLEFVVQPRFVRMQHVSSVWIVLFLIAMSNTLGLFGVVAAPPLAVATQILLQGLLPIPSMRKEKESTGSPAELDERVRSARASIGAMDGAASPEITSLLGRLDDLIQDVDRVAPPAHGEQQALAAKEAERLP
jgi:putative permease